MGKGCFQCTRILVIIFNFLFVLIGCAIVGISIFLYVDQTVKGIKEEMDEKAMVDIILFTAIGIGGITIVVSTFGCCGAYHESECLLGTYFFCLFVIIAAEIAAVVVGFIKLDKKTVEDNITKALLSSINRYSKSGFKDPLPPHLANIQKYLKCCGARNYMDYVAAAGTVSTVNKANLLTACSSESDGEGLSGMINSLTDSATRTFGPGCTSKIMSIWETHGIWILAVAAAIVAFEVIAMIVALCLCCSVCRADDGYVGVAT